VCYNNSLNLLSSQSPSSPLPPPSCALDILKEEEENEGEIVVDPPVEVKVLYSVLIQSIVGIV